MEEGRDICNILTSLLHKVVEVASVETSKKRRKGIVLGKKSRAQKQSHPTPRQTDPPVAEGKRRVLG